MYLDHKLLLGKILFSLSISGYLTECVPDAYLRLPCAPACSHKQNKRAFDIEFMVLFKHQENCSFFSYQITLDIQKRVCDFSELHLY